MSNCSGNEDKQKRKSCWSNLVQHYERRNASLERRHNALAERVRMMELALPSLLMGVVVNLNPLSEEKTTGHNIEKKENPLTNVDASPQLPRVEKISGAID